MDAMIRTVARHLRYTPETIDNLYFDDIDYHGLEYWYNDAVELAKEYKAKK